MNMFKQLIVAVAGTIVMFAYNLFNDDRHLSGLDWVKIVNMAVGAVLVWWVANGPRGSGLWQYAKTAAMGLQAALVTFLSIIEPSGEVSWPNSAEWWQIIIAVLTTLGVLVTPGPRLVRPVHEAAESKALG